MTSHYYNMFDMAKNHPGSFEMKDAIIINSVKAIKDCNKDFMYQGVTTFNPDRPEDGTDVYTKKYVKLFVEKTGIEAYVLKEIEKKNA